MKHDVVQSERLLTLNKKTMTMTKTMAMTNTFRKHPQRVTHFEDDVPNVLKHL